MGVCDQIFTTLVAEGERSERLMNDATHLKLSIIAKDVSAASALLTELSAEDVLDKETKTQDATFA